MTATATRALYTPFNCLIVEDNKSLAMSLERIVNNILGQWYQTSSDWASSEEEAMAFCAKKTYNLIIMDYHLKFTVGSKITKSILEKYPTTHIVGCSACADDPAVKEDCIQTGMKEVIPKGSQKIKQFLTDLGERSLIERFRAMTSG